MTTPLPVSARIAWWGTSWLRGHVVADELIDAVSGDSVQQVVAGIGEGTETVLGALAAWRSTGATAFGAAFPVEGDPIGLGGPPAFNTAALEAGEAVIAVSAHRAMTPTAVGPTYEWQVHHAQPRQVPDVGEADRGLRAALVETARLLADLDVARWRPEVADRLLNLRHREALVAPPGVPPRCVDLAARGLQATGIVDLALEDDGGAITAYEISARRGALTPLDRAARRALVAACSPEVWPPG